MPEQKEQEIEFYFNQNLYNAYRSYPVNQRLGLNALAKKWKLRKAEPESEVDFMELDNSPPLVAENPLKGKKIILNCHITRSTLILVDLLLLAGAEVTVTAAKELSVHENIVEVLKAAKVSYVPYEGIKEEHKENYYDVVIDCGAGLLNVVKPIEGAVELTYTNPNLYKNIDYPVITIDQADLKSVETNYGTGDGLVRALKKYIKTTSEYISLSAYYSKNVERLQQLIDKTVASKKGVKKIYKECLSDDQEKLDSLGNKLLFENQIYIIFGGGKVGTGIAANLKKAGVDPKNITIIDLNFKRCKEAIFDGYNAIQLSKDKSDEIKEAIKKASCVITATGTEGCISQNFKKSDFPETTLKVNMGTPDEWGTEFDDKDILNNKKAVNSTFEDYIQLTYREPILKALLIAVEYIVENQPKLKPIIQPLPANIAMEIIVEWQQHYPEFYKANAPLWENISAQNFPDYVKELIKVLPRYNFFGNKIAKETTEKFIQMDKKYSQRKLSL